MDQDSLLGPVVALIVRHALTGLAGTLITLGWLDAGEKTSFVTIGAGLAVGLVGVAWSWWQKVGQARMIALLRNLSPKSHSPPKTDPAA